MDVVVSHVLVWSAAEDEYTGASAASLPLTFKSYYLCIKLIRLHSFKLLTSATHCALRACESGQFSALRAPNRPESTTSNLLKTLSVILL